MVKSELELDPKGNGKTTRTFKFTKIDLGSLMSFCLQCGEWTKGKRVRD